MFLKQHVDGGSLVSGQGEEMTDRFAHMQKTMSILQKKEQFAKKTLYESQIKWTHFSADIVRVCKELINTLEQHNIHTYQMRDVDPKG